MATLAELADNVGLNDEEDETLLEEVAPETAEAIDPMSGAVEPSTVEGLGQQMQLNRDQALSYLRSAREDILGRKEDKRGKWLALAQGMLAPTKTGGFGESLGVTAGLLQQERALGVKREEAEAAKLREIALSEQKTEATYVTQQLALARIGATTGKGSQLHGAIQTVVHPDDVDEPVSRQRLILGAARKDGTMMFLKDPDDPDAYIIDADKQDPARQAAIRRAIVLATSEEERGQSDIENGIGAMQARRDTARGLQILSQENIKTSGLQGIKTQFAQWVGVELPDTVDLAELQGILGDDYLQRLEAFTGSKSDRELTEAKSLSAGIGKNTTQNYRRLRRLESMLTRVWKRGLREAYGRQDRSALLDMGHDPSLPLVKSKEAYEELESQARYYEELGGAVFVKP